MDLKFTRLSGYIICASLILTIVCGQPPPPPEVPKDTDHIRLDSTIPELNTISDVTGLPECPGIICTMEYIPDECVHIPVLQRDGINCTGCKQWKESCERGNMIQDGLSSDVQCPVVSCPNVKIPPECQVVETYLYLGKSCNKCPTRKGDCPANVIDSNQAQCPQELCAPQSIPAECQFIPTFEVNGIQCPGCPQWRPGCQGNFQENLQDKAQCPQESCAPHSIPIECIYVPTFEVNGVQCPGCPQWRQGCQATNAQNLAQCPQESCAPQSIPAECQYVPTFEFNGIQCPGCPQWRPGCQGNFQENLQDKAQCPQESCAPHSIPIECIYVPTFEINGIQCPGCPQWRQGCQAKSLQNQCPQESCAPNTIPTECQYTPTFEVNGIQCPGCPQWRPGCQPSRRIVNPQIPQIACPLIACEINVPLECRIAQKFEHGGRMCDKCPTWREGCRETERINTVFTGAVDHNGNRVQQSLCPIYPCRELNVPTNCIQENPYDYRGRACFKCPTVRPECLPPGALELDQGTPPPPEIPCPMLRCERQAGIPDECYQPEQFTYRGKVCQDCPSIKPECRIANPPRRIAAVDPLVTRSNIPDTQCPMMGCPFIYIPPECRDVPTFQHNGKTCQGCPVYREGCMPSMTRPIPTPNTAFPEIPPRTVDIQCPVRACPMIQIPPDCRIEQPYQFQGRICYDCPTWREGCLQQNLIQDRPVDVPPISCPLFGCPRIYIPPECREEQTFQIRGRTCNMCPKWRDGCIPSSDNNNLLGPNKVILGSTTTATPSNVPEKSCPLMKCTRILIPKECREEESFIYEGKTCYKCPKWREGCVPGNSNRLIDPVPATTSKPLPIDQNTGMNDGLWPTVTESPDSRFAMQTSTPPSLTNLKGVIPVNKIIDTVNAVSCPALRCPQMFIPLYCREETSYVYQGRTCRGCQRWRLGCSPMNNAPFSSNPNGILSFSLFNELLAT